MLLTRLFQPLALSLRGYDLGVARRDFIAGATTSVLLIPQGMAYAMLAGLPPIVGLYAALVAPAAYALVGTSRQLSVGPAALDSLLVAAGVGAIAQAESEAYLTAAILLALMVGVLQIAMGFLRVGFFVNFLSRPVISGFTSAAALVIGLSQVKHLAGVPLPSSQNAYVLVRDLSRVLSQVSWPTLLVSVVSIFGLLSFKKWAKKWPGPLLVVSLVALAVSLLGWGDKVALVGSVPAGLPRPRLSFVSVDLLRALLPTAATLAVIGFMESISIASRPAREKRYDLNPDRELLALGAANVSSAFFGGYGVAGSFSRTSVNTQAGATTQLASFFAGLFVFFALLFLTPLVAFLPQAVLSALIFVSVLGLVDVAQMKRLLHIKRADLGLLLITFFATLFWGIVEGMASGVVGSLLWFVGRTARPHVALLGRVPGTRLFRNTLRHQGLTKYRGILLLRMDAQFYFGNVAFLKEKLHEFELAMGEPLRAVVLDASAINQLDSSAEEAWSEMLEEFEVRKVIFCLAGLKGPVLDVLERSGLAEKFGERARCPTVHAALEFLSGQIDVSVLPTVSGTKPSGRDASGHSAHL